MRHCSAQTNSYLILFTHPSNIYIYIHIILHLSLPTDNFNVFDLHSKENYYANYSVQGPKHPRSYMHQVDYGSERYSFIAIDACLKPGPKRPFNFVGALDDVEIGRITKLMNESRESQADYIVWFGHYPTSCIMAPNDGGVRAVIGILYVTLFF